MVNMGLVVVVVSWKSAHGLCCVVQQGPGKGATETGLCGEWEFHSGEEQGVAVEGWCLKSREEVCDGSVV